MAAALVGTLSVVADVGTHSELLALVLICETPQKPHDTQRKYKAPYSCKKTREKLSQGTLTSVTSTGCEARFAGAERVCAVDHAVSFISVSTDRLVTATVIQHCVCGQGNGQQAVRGWTLPMWQIHCGSTYLSYCSWLHQSHSPHSRWSSCSAELSWCNGRSSTRTRPFGTLVWRYSLLEENKGHREVIFNMLHMKNYIQLQNNTQLLSDVTVSY